VNPIGAADTAHGERPGTSSLGTTLLGLAALVGLAVTVGLGLGLPATREQGEYSRLIAIHPPLAWAAYVALGTTAVASALWLWQRTRSITWDLVAGASAEIAVVFTVLTLVTGSIWGRPTWGVWWVWDARLTLTAIMLVLELGYLALRRVPGTRDVRATRAAIAALLAAAVVPINHMAVEWWRTLHQGRSLFQSNPGRAADPEFIAAMLVGFVAMTLLYSWLLVHRLRVARFEERLEEIGLATALAERRAEGLVDLEREVVVR
jgi:heme exporter protein C